MTKILVIEDDAFLRKIVCTKLAQKKYSVVEATDGKEGLKIITEARPDIVLLDLVLPGMNGFEVLKEIKKDPTIANTPVIILSNLGQAEDIDKGFETGAADFLIKAHFTPSEIIDKVEAVLAKNKPAA